MKSFRHFITEALLDVDSRDIDMIYAPFVKPCKELQAVWNKHIDGKITPTTWDKIDKSRMQQDFREVIARYNLGLPLKVFDSRELQSAVGKQAHATKPIKILTYLFGYWTNTYNPIHNTINICLQMDLYHLMTSKLDLVPASYAQELKNETSDVDMKATIRHELTHWLEDAIHNSHITNAAKNIQKVKTSGGNWQKTQQKSLWRGEADSYLSPSEINAFVHGIAELKRRLGQEAYDKLTWKDLLALYPSLGGVDYSLGAEFRRKMFTRMSREGLLGPKMRT